MAAVVGGLLEVKASLKQFVLLACWGSHDCAELRAEHMLGHDSEIGADWTAKFRVRVMNYEASCGEVLGGPDVEVEVVEMEFGRKKKGIDGHDNSVIGDVRGVFERGTVRVVLELYKKLHSLSDERRFGPPNSKEASQLFDHIASGSLLFAHHCCLGIPST